MRSALTIRDQHESDVASLETEALARLHAAHAAGVTSCLLNPRRSLFEASRDYVAASDHVMTATARMALVARLLTVKP